MSYSSMSNNICTFCGKIGSFIDKCHNCHCSNIVEIKGEYTLNGCPIWFEDFDNIRKRYFTCGHCICMTCKDEYIGKCPLCREGKMIEIEKFGYFNIMPERLLDKVNDLKYSFKHMDILRYLEWCYACEHAIQLIKGLPPKFNIFNIWQKDISISKWNRSREKEHIFCNNESGYITRFYQVYEVYEKLFDYMPLINDEFNMRFFINTEHQLFVRTIGGKTYTLCFNYGDTVMGIKYKLYDIIHVPPVTMRFIHAGKNLSNDRILTERYMDATLHYVARCMGD